MVSTPYAAIEGSPQQNIIVEVHVVMPVAQKASPSILNAEMAGASEAVSQQRRVLRQLAELTPEQREQLRNQIREHRQRQREQQQRAQNIAPVSAESPSGIVRPQSLSPEERHEFRQWMQQRQERR